MAYMFPESLPSRASAGEKRMYEILRKLPGDCIVYYEPRVRDRHPDFVVIIPKLGLLVIEVKGWFAGSILGGDHETVLVEDKRIATRQPHPLKQARDYMFRLMGHCKENLWGRSLLNEGGSFEGKFCFPFGYMALLSNITADQLEQQCGESVRQIFPAERVLTRDALEGLAGLNGDQLWSF